MDTETAYNQALDYLYSFVDYSLKKSSELARADFNLERMRALMHLLGDPQDRTPSLHVAGTKGKGSTCAFASSALSAGGYRTGLYTSPHLQDFCERIQVDGQPIHHADLVALVEQVKPAVARVPMLTTFEITTALAFLHFAQVEAQAAVIEVGLGGRLDATNIIQPLVSVITSLSYDHMAVLGSTLTQIAGEKAGIIKPGVPVVSSPQVPEAAEVLERVAHTHGCTLTRIGQEVTCQALAQDLDGQTFRLTFGEEKSVILRIPLLGQRQVINAAAAYAALRVSHLELDPAAIASGFARVQWPCRFEIARRDPPIIFDSAHNGDSFARLRQALDEIFPTRPIILILGASEDKHLEEMLAHLQPRLKLLIATRADHPRALPVENILASAAALGISAQSHEPVSAALQKALALAQADGSLILAAGSMFATAEVKTAWQKIHP